MKNNKYQSRQFLHIFAALAFVLLILSAASYSFFALSAGAQANEFDDLKLPALSIAPMSAQRKSEVQRKDERPPAEAQGSQIPAPSGGAELRLLNLRIAGNADSRSDFSLIAVFNRKPDFSFMALGRPPRLIMNLPAVQFSFNPDNADKSGRLASLRYGASGQAGARLIFGLKQPFRIIAVRSDSLASSAGAGWQIEVKLAPVSEEEFRQYLHEREIAGETGEKGVSAGDAGTEKQKAAALAGEQKKAKQIFTVAIDPGHGDFDSGAISIDGIKEKNVTLAFSQALYQALLEKPGIKPYLTRSRDTYLKLGARTDEARAAGANLFVSIHADHIDDGSLHGATVYTLSDKASDAMAKSLADYENKSDLLGGASASAPPAISDILMEMTQRETRDFSESFAGMLVKNLRKGGIALIKNPRRAANFQVLRVADIPSVLVEIGYLSNREDERNITDPVWQKKMADIMADSIAAYARLHRKK